MSKAKSKVQYSEGVSKFKIVLKSNSAIKPLPLKIENPELILSENRKFEEVKIQIKETPP